MIIDEKKLDKLAELAIKTGVALQRGQDLLLTVMAKSKWFNAVHVRGTETDISALLNLPFILFRMAFVRYFAKRLSRGPKHETSNWIADIRLAFILSSMLCQPQQRQS